MCSNIKIKKYQSIIRSYVKYSGQKVSNPMIRMLVSNPMIRMLCAQILKSKSVKPYVLRAQILSQKVSNPMIRMLCAQILRSKSVKPYD